jgi:hypothetical protein
MKKLLVLLTTVAIFATTAGMALAINVTYTFEDQLAGSSQASLVYPLVTFTNTQPVNLFIQNPAPGPVLSGNCILAYDGNNTPDVWQQATFASSIIVHMASVAMGDFDADQDTFVLNAYDQFGNLLDTDTKINLGSTYGGPYLSVTSPFTPIAYVQFNETAEFWGSMYYDNFSICYTPVPVPPSLLLLGSGLLGLVGVRRFKA